MLLRPGDAVYVPHRSQIAATNRMIETERNIFMCSAGPPVMLGVHDWREISRIANLDQSDAANDDAVLERMRREHEAKMAKQHAETMRANRNALLAFCAGVFALGWFVAELLEKFW